MSVNPRPAVEDMIRVLYRYTYTTTFRIFNHPRNIQAYLSLKFYMHKVPLRHVGEVISLG